MGWKTDWLYHLVFEQFEHAWAKAQKEGESRFGPASARLVISQYNERHEAGSPYYCRGGSSRSWNYAGRHWEEETSSVECVAEDNAVHGMFYHTALGRFYISEDRKTVIIEYTFGPRYGRGFVFLVKGQGKAAELLPKPDSITWCS